MKILIIEDEVELLSAAKSYLSSEGFICEGVTNYLDAVDRLRTFSYDCIVADVGLPDGNGLDLITELRKKVSETGVIIISARNSIRDKVEGLEIGADDYLTKPFHLSELNARVKSILRRRKSQGAKEFEFNEIQIFPDQLKAAVKGQALQLTQKEMDLLIYFVSNRDRILTKESIVDHLWSDFSASGNSNEFIYTHVSNLRRKLLEKGAKDYVKTIYGVGYKFTSE